MAEIKGGNWSFRDPGDDIPSGSTISGGNFTQLEPDTPILVGKTLTITGGNWCNVRQDAAWTVTGVVMRQVDKCTHLHRGLLSTSYTPCAEVCRHVVDTDEIYVDGELIETIHHYGDTYQ
jgi:hypothetical protein